MESKILRTIGFNLNISLPYDILDQMVKSYYSKGINYYLENIYYTSKIILFDFFRS